jgi:hypothetical protein
MEKEMKKLILLVILATSILSAQANSCKKIYHDKGIKRDNLTTVALFVVGAGVSGAAGTGAIVLMGPAIIGGAVATAGTQAGVYSLYAVSIGSLGLPKLNINNKFEKIENIISASQSDNINHKHFQKLISKIRKNSTKINCERINSLTDLQLNIEVAEFVNQSNEDSSLCPEVVLNNGRTRTALFRTKSLANYYVTTQCSNI